MDRYTILLSKIYKYIEKCTEDLKYSAITTFDTRDIPRIQAEYHSFWDLKKQIKKFEEEIKNMEKTDNE